MWSKKIQSLVLKTVFSLIGLYSFVLIVNDYGVEVIKREMARSGVMLVFLTLTFIPTLFCYAGSWLLATNFDKKGSRLSPSKKMLLFCQYTAVSIAWNNMTPFLKIGGEPLKYIMLTKHLSKKEAIASTVNYNVIHLLSTALSFVLTSIILFLFYKTEPSIHYSLLLFSFIFPIVLYLIVHGIRKIIARKPQKYYFRFFKVIAVNLNVSLKRLSRFYRNRPAYFFMSLLIDIAGRFIEGLTFFYGFFLIKYKMDFKNAALLDVGRTFIDTVFFFVPFQVGSREQGVHYFMENILNIDTQGFLTVVFFYRFVEIAWVGIGYILWVTMSNSSNELKV